MLEIRTASELQLLSYQRLARLEGLLSTLLPLLFLTIPTGTSYNSPQFITSSIAVASLGFLIFSHQKSVLFSASAILFSLTLSFFTLKATLLSHPGVFLLAAASTIVIIFILSEAFQAERHGPARTKDSHERALWAVAIFPGVIFITMLNRTSDESLRIVVVSSSTLIATYNALKGFFTTSRQWQSIILTGLSILLWGLFSILPFYLFSSLIFFLSLFAFPLIFLRHRTILHHERWYDFLLDHPARNLMGTFLFLALFGTVLLSLPIASAHEPISIINAAFTSVSAVCVTGLTVLDTPHDFSATGQFFLLLLIQIGGLGIMTIATVGIYAVGQRLSLKRERAMVSMMNSSHNDLTSSLKIILLFTFAVEALGAILLTLFFYYEGLPITVALWNGVFTSISAFCNAGFALFSDNLVQFQSNPGILITVSLLIIFGGISPALTVMIPQILKKKRNSEFAFLVFSTTGILLLVGTLSMLLFEWNGVLANLSTGDKILNAWFQSVTFRTAGFNSVSISGFTNIMICISLVLMFIGGSPGGTAGGIKTTTAAVLFLSFSNTVLGNSSVPLKNRVIPQATINKALAIFIAATLIWALGVFLLEMTQSIPLRDVVFEATSAIGTVGLSTGITTQLDEVGKIIIMFLMYAGRISPITLFMLFSREEGQGELEKPEVAIGL